MSTDDKVILTPAEAESLLADGDSIHNFIQAGPMIVGCDYDRADAIKAFQSTVSIEIGGDGCKRMGHAIVVWDSPKHYSFFAADMEKVEAFEAALAAKASSA